VLYLNGIAIAVIELKRSSVELADGVRQLITNQEEIFNKGFFSTVQLVLAGSDSQGLRYGTTGTPEQFFVEWKDEAPQPQPTAAPAAGRAARPAAGAVVPQGAAAGPDPQLHPLRRRAEEGAAPHQFFGVKAAQERIAKREGGVIWHTQGSGKSILMVLIAKWLLEHDPDARILVITDRDELDKQIEGVMKNAGVIGPDSPSPRITSRAEFVEKLGPPHAAPAVRADPQVRSGRPEGARRRPCRAASTCSWTSATAPRAAT
jgi:type I restriction enzyme R subunit